MPTWSEYGVWLRSERQQLAALKGLRLLLTSDATDDEKDAARRIIAKIEERARRRAIKRGEAA